MTDPQTITQLIEDLQAAEVGTRELDLRVAIACGVFAPDNTWKKTGEHTWHKNFVMGDGIRYSNWDDCFQPKFYSTSIDAAMTTIPERWEFGAMLSYVLSGQKLYEPELWDKESEETIIGTHKSIPIAICIASLYAILKELETT